MRFDLRSNFCEDRFRSGFVENRAQKARHEHKNSRDTTRNVVFRWTTPPPDPAGTTLVEADVRSALVTMGFKPAEAIAATATAARAHVGESPPLELLLREALKHCATPRN